jgi:hypothetical protein
MRLYDLYVMPSDFARLKGVEEAKVERWVAEGQLKSTHVHDGDVLKPWGTLVGPIQDQPTPPDYKLSSLPPFVWIGRVSGRDRRDWSEQLLVLFGCFLVYYEPAKWGLDVVYPKIVDEEGLIKVEIAKERARSEHRAR